MTKSLQKCKQTKPLFFPYIPLHSRPQSSVSWGVKNIQKLNELSRETLLFKWLLSNDDLSTVTDKPDYGCLERYNISKIFYEHSEFLPPPLEAF